MLSVITKNSVFYSRQEVWFYNSEKIRHTNNDMYYCAFSKPIFKTEYIEEVTTRLIDLRQSKDYIYNDVDDEIKYSIRRGERTGFVHNVIEKPNEQDLYSYYKSYNKFEKYKEWDNSLSLERLRIFAENNALRISKALINDEDITIHIYLVDDLKRAVLLYSHHNVDYNDYKNRGFANRYHHWNDIMYFKNTGTEIYDIGGVDFVNTPGIANFKKLFGGKSHKQYNFQTTSGLYSVFNKILR